MKSIMIKLYILLALMFSSSLYATDCASPDGSVAAGGSASGTLKYGNWMNSSDRSDFYTFTPTVSTSTTFSVTFEKKVRMILRKNGGWVDAVTSASDGDTITLTANVTSGDTYCIELEMQYPTWTTTSNYYNYTFSISGANTPPVANNKSFTTSKNTALSDNLLNNGGTADSDGDGDTLTASKASNPLHGTVTVNANGDFTYTPASNYSGNDSFTYTIDDGNGGSASATVNITITSDDPIANDKTYTTAVDTVKTANVMNDGGVVDSDPNGDAITVSAHTNPSNGTLSIAANGDFTYTPDSGWTGTDSFEYTITDGTHTDTATASITVFNVGDEPIPTDDTNATNVMCGSFEDVLQTRNNPSEIRHYSGADATIYNSPDCTLSTGNVDFGTWQHLHCSGGDATATGSYATQLNIAYAGHTPETASINVSPSSSSTNKTLTVSQTLTDNGYNKVEVGSGATGSLNVTFSNLYDINTLNFTTHNNVTFSTPTPYNLNIGSVGVVNNGVGNSLTTSTIPKNIKINSFDLPGGTTVNFEASQTIKVETFNIGRDSTNITLKAQYVNINTLHQSNSGSGSSTVTIIADYIDITTIDLDQQATLIIKPYTTGKRVLFEANSISASSSSTMIIDSGNYYTDSFSIPGTGSSSSVIASDNAQLINFHINGDFKPGNNPGINSAGNNKNFGTRPPQNFFLFINGDLATGGGGTTFNATVYVEGDVDFGSPSYLQGALSSDGDIEIGNGSEFYFDQNIANTGWGECNGNTGSALVYQNNYSCGIMDTALTSYKSVTTQQNDIYNTCTISAKGYSLTEDSQHPVECYQDITTNTLCNCDPSQGDCSVNNSCTIVEAPQNKLAYTVYATSLTDTNTTNTDMTFTDKEYGSYTFTKHAANIDFKPTESYNDDTTKLMLLGDIQFAENDQTITFDAGDYYFNSFKIDKDNNGNVNQINICAKDDIRLFIKNDFVYSGNHINDANCGGKIFIYVEGDVEIDANGGGNGTIPLFIYTKGSASVENNGNSNTWYGAITAENEIDVTGQNINFVYDDSIQDFGYGKCALCYDENYVHTNGIFGMCMPMMFTCKTDLPIRNISDEKLDDVKVIETYKSSMRMSFPFGSIYDTIDKDGNHVGNGATVNSSSDYSIFMADIALHSDSITYDFGNDYPIYNTNEEYYRAYKQITMSMNFDFTSWSDNVVFLGSYTDKQGRKYNVRMASCENFGGSGNSTYLTGPFDAWDVSRDTLVTPPSDRNISTKIVNKAFKLSLASLNKTNDAYEPKAGDVDVAIYPKNSLVAISNHITFHATTAHIHETTLQDFNVTHASKDAVVGFKLCTKYENNVTTGTIDYTLYPNSSCSSSSTVHECNATTSGTPTWHICYSSDNLAIRPKEFTITEITTPIKAAKHQLFTIEATQNGSGASVDYNVSNNDYVLSLTTTKYMPDDSVNNSLHGTATLSSYSFTNGSSTDTNISYSDVGKINITLEDKNWAAVDTDDTPASCNDNGRYICGDTNATFIPSHFKITNPKVYNYKNATYTYYTEDFNISASIDVILEAQNELNTTVQNFDTNSWENPIDVNFTIATAPLANLKTINNAKIGFSNGSAHILYTETNSSKNLLFNLDRAINTPKNPVKINGADITLYTSSSYTQGGATTTITEKTAPTASDDATFVYGRTHATRQRFLGDSGKVKIFFETYCYGAACNKTLLPDGTNSKTIDDPRWFVNRHHTASQGSIGTLTQKGASSHVTVDSISVGSPTEVTLKYDKQRGYPYKATMENNASHWLIYNKYNAGATTNEFAVEFTNDSHSWAGKYETNTTTQQNAKDSINRRIMW